MSQYQVPQFIDVEDKVFGPLTIKQFLYLGGGALMNVIVYSVFKPWVLLVLGFPFAALALALAFYKYNGVPFPKVFISMTRYVFSKKLYLWKKKEAEGSILQGIEALPHETPQSRKLYVEPPKHKRQSQKLQDLAWTLDVHQFPR